MTSILQAVQAYFETPLSQCPFYYEKARLEQEKNGALVYSAISEEQPIGKEWELVCVDQLSPQLSYAHVCYDREDGFCDDILFFLKVQDGWTLVNILRARTPAKFCSISSPIPEEVTAYQELAQAMRIYSTGLYEMDAELALTVFGSDSRMNHPTDGISFADVSCTVFRERWAGFPTAEETGLKEFMRVYRIDLLNATTAVVKVGVAKLEDHFKDYLSCVKIGGKWIVAHKITQGLWKGAPI